MKKKEKKKRGEVLTVLSVCDILSTVVRTGSARCGVFQKKNKKTLESIDNNAVDVIESVHLRNGGMRRDI